MIQEDAERARTVAERRETHSVDDLLRDVLVVLDDKKAEELTAFYIEPISTLADYIVIVTATSSRHLNVMADAIRDMARQEEEYQLINPEGTQDDDWLVLDFGTVLVHLFSREFRKRYRLEEIYGKGENVDIAAVLGNSSPDQE